MNERVFTWKIGGVGGYGLQSASSLLAKTFVRFGLFAHGYDEFPSIIKGGHASSQVSVSAEEIRSQRRQVDALVSLNDASIHEHAGEIHRGGWLIYDSDVVESRPSVRSDVTVFPVPMTRLTREIGADKLVRNVVAVGLTLGLSDTPTDVAKAILHEEYAPKGDQIVSMNQRALEAGAAYAREHRPADFAFHWHRPSRPQPRMFISGNDALSIGAVAAGCRFYAAYPMTPSSSILMYLMKHGPAKGMVVRQLQDEIAVIHAGIGAAHAGVRAMVGTSGGGFSLMSEAVGLAGMTETPIVIIDAQRVGPATGMPTWTEQSDLRFVLHAGQGDFPRIVLAPGDPEECFRIMPTAFNLADRYQLPVIVLTDKFLADSSFTVPVFSQRGLNVDRGELISQGSLAHRDDLFPRYAPTKTGVSPRPLLGIAGHAYLANSDEHDAYGLSNETPAVRTVQHEKRLRKLESARRDLPAPVLYGPRRAELTVVGWGSVKQAVLDAIDMLEPEGMKVNFIHSQAVWPLPERELQSGFASAERLVLVEGNATGQFGGLLREHLGLDVNDQILRYDGRPFEATELADEFSTRIRRSK